MHQLFQEFISQYCLKPELTEPLKDDIVEVWNEINKENVELEKNYREQLNEVNKKLDKIEEKHYVLEEMNKETFQKFYFKYKQEQIEAADQLAKVTSEISNHEVIAKKAVSISTELNAAWASGDVREKNSYKNYCFLKELCTT